MALVFSELPADVRKQVLRAQRNEITEAGVYLRMARRAGGKNGELLEKIAQEESGHYERWEKLSGREVKPSQFAVFFYSLVAGVFGLSFGLKLMERGEKSAQVEYGKILEFIPSIKDIIEDEDRHERTLLNMLDEEKLQYVGSIVLGLNDALVELTGALAGLSFALQRTRLIAVTAFITGIAASFSMAASEYLSTKAEAAEDGGQDGGTEEPDGTSLKNPIKASVYTGIAYVSTVLLLILPYLLFNNYIFCLAMSLMIAVFIIFFFNYYISVAKDLAFGSRFLEMLFISLGIALLSFGIGVLVRIFFHVEV